MHRALRRAGVDAELHVLEAAPHGGFLGMAPEDAEIAAEVRRFIDRWCPIHPQVNADRGLRPGDAHPDQDRRSDSAATSGVMSRWGSHKSS